MNLTMRKCSAALPRRCRWRWSAGVGNGSAQAPNRLHTQATSASGKRTSGAWLFIYFKEPGNQGIYLALSRDGYPLHAAQRRPAVGRARASGRADARRFPHARPRWPIPHGVDLELARQLARLRVVARSAHMVRAETKFPSWRIFPRPTTSGRRKFIGTRRNRQWLLIWSSSMKDSTDGNRIWFSTHAGFRDLLQAGDFLRSRLRHHRRHNFSRRNRPLPAHLQSSKLRSAHLSGARCDGANA